ncbi:MAG: trimethylamine methyltransferase family protein [Bacillota bacterium]
METVLSVLSPEERHRIHQASLEILAETGVEFPSDTALRCLADSGAKVDFGAKRALIPPGLVEEALGRAPSSVTLGGLNPEMDAALDGSCCHVGTDGSGSYTRDFDTGQQRPSTLKDLVQATIIAEALDPVRIYWGPVIAGDVPANVRPLKEFFEAARWTGKHIQHEIHRPQEVPFVFEALQVLTGGREQAAARRVFSVVCCPVSPLRHDGPMTEAVMALTEYGVPVVPLPMPMAGATAPASLMGTVIVNNVEVLSSLTLLQSCTPGTPVVYGAAGSVMDMRRGTFAAGAPEEGLINAACAEMAGYYGLPSITTGLVTDAVEPGVQASLEKVTNGIIPMLAGSDGVIGIGLLQSDQCLCLEQMVLDAEMCLQIERVQKGIDTGPGMSLVELIKSVGPGGNFLAEESTCRLVRLGEHYIPQLYQRLSHDAWVQEGKPGILSMARERVKEILRDPLPGFLDEYQVKELERILQKAGLVL